MHGHTNILGPVDKKNLGCGREDCRTIWTEASSDKGNDAEYKTNPKINEMWGKGSYKIED